MAKEIINNINKSVFWVCLVASIILLTTSFFLPPTGEIHPSALQGVGELFAFAALWTVVAAIERGIDAKLQKGDTTLEINNPDGTETE